MEDFQIIQPSLLLAPYVKQYWFMRITEASASTIRTVPAGQISLIFHRGNRLFSATEKDYQPRAFLCGHGKTFMDLEYSGVVDMITVVFQPTGANTFFQFPMSEVNGLQTDLYDLEDTELLDLQKSLEDATTNQLCVLFIEQFLLKRLRNQIDYNLKRLDTAIRLINTGQVDINALADASCLSPRQFNRVFTEYIGARPKEFQRIVRFQKALFLLQSEPTINLAQLAIECGYYDQPHLIKEFKAFSGYTPVEYLTACAPYSDYFS